MNNMILRRAYLYQNYWTYQWADSSQRDIEVMFLMAKLGRCVHTGRVAVGAQDGQVVGHHQLKTLECWTNMLVTANKERGKKSVK